MVGVTLMLLPACPVVIQLYVLAPEAESTAVSPEQMAAGVAVAVTTGLVFTITCTVAVLLQVPPLDPVTV